MCLVDNLIETTIIIESSKVTSSELIDKINLAFKNSKYVSVYMENNIDDKEFNINMKEIIANAQSILFMVLWQRTNVVLQNVEASTDDSNTVKLIKAYGSNILLKNSKIDVTTWNIIGGYGFNIS